MKVNFKLPPAELNLMEGVYHGWQLTKWWGSVFEGRLRIPMNHCTIESRGTGPRTRMPLSRCWTLRLSRLCLISMVAMWPAACTITWGCPLQKGHKSAPKWKTPLWKGPYRRWETSNYSETNDSLTRGGNLKCRFLITEVSALLITYFSYLSTDYYDYFMWLLLIYHLQNV